MIPLILELVESKIVMFVWGKSLGILTYVGTFLFGFGQSKVLSLQTI